MRTHGTIRSMRPVSETSHDGFLEFRKGTSRKMRAHTALVAVSPSSAWRCARRSVRLWPRKHADIMDMALKGKVAIVEAIENDYDDQPASRGRPGR